jgi:hypothetical protein
MPDDRKLRPIELIPATDGEGGYAPEFLAAMRGEDTTAADPSEYLAAVQERWGAADGMTWHDYPTALELLGQALRSLADVPRLLAAVEAALALCGGDRHPLISVALVREAITTALLGEVPDAS